MVDPSIYMMYNMGDQPFPTVFLLRGRLIFGRRKQSRARPTPGGYRLRPTVGSCPKTGIPVVRQ